MKRYSTLLALSCLTCSSAALFGVDVLKHPIGSLLMFLAGALSEMARTSANTRAPNEATRPQEGAKT